MSGLQQHIDSFLELTLQHLRGHAVAGPLQAEVERLRLLWPRADQSAIEPTPARLPVCDHLSTALALASGGTTASLARAIMTLAPVLQWTYSYPNNGQKDDDLANRIAFCQIAGSRGLIANADIHVGLTLIAPHTAYPVHAHPATEVYLVVSGRAVWQAGDVTTPQPPDTAILHPGNVPHAMTTDDEPLLAIWTWRGDLASPSTYLK